MKIVNRGRARAAMKKFRRADVDEACSRANDISSLFPRAPTGRAARVAFSPFVL